MVALKLIKLKLKINQNEETLYFQFAFVPSLVKWLPIVPATAFSIDLISELSTEK